MKKTLIVISAGSITLFSCASYIYKPPLSKGAEVALSCKELGKVKLGGKPIETSAVGEKGYHYMVRCEEKIDDCHYKVGFYKYNPLYQAKDKSQRHVVSYIYNVCLPEDEVIYERKGWQKVED